MKLASFKANGRMSYGAVTGNGIIDLGRKLSKYPTLLDLLRAQAIPEARAAASGQPDLQVKDVEMLPPILAPDKNICVGINYPGPQRRVQGQPGGAEISQPVLPVSNLARGRRAADRAAESIGQVRL